MLLIYYAIVNYKCNFKLRLLNLNAFSKVADLQAHYSLNLVITK
jgi:hypothetical protein